MSTSTYDVDSELQAWQEVNAEADGLLQRSKNERHRCPMDMPPCPECEARYEEEDDREYV